jgi:nitrite reductase/ring-hydroxylating ferredoxin subunit
MTTLANAGTGRGSYSILLHREFSMAFYALAKANELTEGFKRTVKLPSVTLFIFYHEGELHIIEDRCPHMDVPLATGTLESTEQSGPLIRCRAHGIGFYLSNGKAEGMWSDTLNCLKFYPPVYRDYNVGVDIDEGDEDRE